MTVLSGIRKWDLLQTFTTGLDLCVVQAVPFSRSPVVSVAVLTALYYSFLEISQELCLSNLDHSVYRLDVFGVDGP